MRHKCIRDALGSASWQGPPYGMCGRTEDKSERSGCSRSQREE
jgi:hypothetical protein